jgi:hypothetical protein
MKLYTEEQVRLMIEKSRETGLTAEFLTLTTPPIELPSDEDIEKVKAIKDESGHWYIIPNELVKEFHKDESNEDMIDSGEFGNKWGGYMTGGGLNLVQLYAKKQILNQIK